ncbi:hypothetical protein FRC00_006821 [Tulasnella sp. 408]|nr:hypothetical protein FRC00_006821 [Tulasnella sp. 408]
MSQESQKPIEQPASAYNTYTQPRFPDGPSVAASDARWEMQLPSRYETPTPGGSSLPSYPLRPAQYHHYRSTSSWSVQSNNDLYSDSYARSNPGFSQSSIDVAAPSRTQYEPAGYSARSPSTGVEQEGEVDLHPSGRPRKGLWALVDAPNNNTGNPGYSIKVLMEYAIKGSPRGKLSLQEIYLAVEERYPIFKTSFGQNWRNSARHDISMDPRFKNVPRGPEEPGKGGLWMFDENAPPKPRKPRKKRVPQEKAASAPTTPENSTYASIRPRPLRPRDTAPYPPPRRPEHPFPQQGGSMTLPGVENLFQQSM